MLSVLLHSTDVDDYEWIVVLSGFFAFFAAFGVGANDVANAFATSVGSKAFTVKQAIILGAIFEFLGAVLMGSHVAKTIQGGIADLNCFQDNAPVLMYGMMSSIIAVGIWLMLASYYELPVSTTHSSVGAVIGMAVALKGTGCVLWAEQQDTFPYTSGVMAIIISWFLSPILCGAVAMTLFSLLRQFVLRRSNALQLSFAIFPLVIFLAVSINIFFVIYKGAKGLNPNLSLGAKLGLAFGVGGFCSLVVSPFLIRFIKKSIAAHPTTTNEDEETELNKIAVAPKDCNKLKGSSNTDDIGLIKSAFSAFMRNLSSNLNDIHMSKAHTVDVQEIHDQAEIFDADAEKSFAYVQVFTAILDSFSHGANDVANAVGPFAAVYYIYKEGKVKKNAELGNDMYWILALGGLGISCGLAIYGYKIMRALGVKMCKITPSRGFIIELSAAIVIILGTQQGWPLSTTHCQVGATVGVGMLEGKKGVNGKLLFKTIIGWAATLVSSLPLPFSLSPSLFLSFCLCMSVFVLVA